MRGWAAAGAASVLWWSACVLCGAWIPAAAHAQSPPGVASPDSVASPDTALTAGPTTGLPIQRIVYERHGVFDPAPPGVAGSVFRLIDDLHIRTREQTVRQQLLFKPGDPWNVDRAEETERALRALDIFDQVKIDASRDGDSAVIHVRTRDSWTTSPEFQLQRGGGRTYGSVEISERNLLGRAKFISLAYREAPEGLSRSVEVSDPGMFGSRVQAVFLAASGSSGDRTIFGVERPFYAEDTPQAFGARRDRSDNQVHLYVSGGALAAEFPRERKRIDAYAGLGHRHGGTIRRLTASWLTLDRTLGASTAAPGAPPEFSGDEEVLHLRRFAIEGRLWRPRFVERTEVEGLTGIEDFDLGSEVSLTGGASLRALGGSTDEGFAAFRLGIGTDRHRAGFGWVRAGGSTRLLAGPLESTGEVEARWVNQTIPRHTLVVAAFGAGGYRTSRDFQVILGGLNGLRAHGVQALAGDRMLRLNAESRWLLGRALFQLVSLGAAGFWDAGRTRGPGSGDGRLRQDVGLGIRLSLPGSALARVARFDIAWTVSPAGVGPRKPVFSFGSSQAF